MSDQYRSVRSRVSRPFRHFRQDTHGVAATEFALLVPVMLLIYVGTVEVTEAVYVDRRVTLVTRIAGDLAGRIAVATPSMADYQDKVSASINAMTPVDATGFQIRLTSYGIDKGGTAGAARAFVDFQISCTVGSTQLATCVTGSAAVFGASQQRCSIDPDIPVGSMLTGTPLLRMESTYTHKPILQKLFQGGSNTGIYTFLPFDGIVLKRAYYTWPRGNVRVPGPANNMPVKGGASADQSLSPASAAVCQSPGIAAADRFVP